MSMNDKEYSRFRKRNEAAKPAVDIGNWWLEEGDDRGRKAFAAAQYIEDDQQYRRETMLMHARLHSNFDLQGFRSRDYAVSMSDRVMPRAGRIGFNLIASGTDALTSKLGKNRPKPFYSTSGGTYRQQRSARRLNQFVQGIFYEGEVYRKTESVFRNACVFGTGLMKVYLNEKGRARFEPVMPHNVWVDDAEAQFGDPRSIFQVHHYSKEVLKTMFPAHADKINAAKQPDDAYQKGFGDIVKVVEAWHKRSSDTSKDGVHVIAIEGCELHSEPWEHDFFPFAKFTFRPKLMGFWGAGVAELLCRLQIEMNRLMESVSEQLRRKGRGRIFAPKASIQASQLTNRIGDVVFYNGGVPPTVDASAAVSGEEFQQIDRLYQKAMQEIGVTELSVTGKKPSGLDAAVAIREYNDVESDRFAKLGQNWESFHMDLSDIAISLVHASKSKGYKVRFPNGRSAVEVDWADLDFDRESLIQQCFPASSLPSTPSARRQAVAELKADGYIDQTEARKLLDMPDLEAENSLGTAAIDDVDATIAAIVDDKEPRLIPVDERQDLELLIKRAQATYLKLRHLDVEPRRLAMLGELIDDATALLEPPAPADPMLGAPPMPGMPPPMPGAPPPPGAPPMLPPLLPQ